MVSGVQGPLEDVASGVPRGSVLDPTALSYICESYLI